MISFDRLFFDITYTRTQAGTSGITRTVRNLLLQSQRLMATQGKSCTPVAFHRTGFRAVPTESIAKEEKTHVRAGATSTKAFKWATGRFVRSVILVLLRLPWFVLQPLWAISSSWTFDSLIADGKKITFKPGDVLFMCDASWNYQAWTAARLAREQGAKVVFVLYDLMPLTHPQFCFALVPYIFKQWLVQMLGCSDAVLCISKATEKGLRDYAREKGVGLPPVGNFHLGSDAVSPNRTETARVSVEKFMTQGPPCFAAIGSFEPKKNYEFLLDTFEGIWSRGAEIRLVIIGRETAESRELIERVRKHPEQGKRLMVMFDATDVEVAFAYASCRALVFPSLAEGFGLPLVEARARGGIVIASSLPAFVELADSGVFIYPEGSRSALEALIIEHSENDIRAQVPPMIPFSWEDSAAHCMRLLEKLLMPEHTL